jgi:hypothetical protein
LKKLSKSNSNSSSVSNSSTSSKKSYKRLEPEELRRIIAEKIDKTKVKNTRRNRKYFSEGTFNPTEAFTLSFLLEEDICKKNNDSSIKSKSCINKSLKKIEPKEKESQRKYVTIGVNTSPIEQDEKESSKIKSSPTKKDEDQQQQEEETFKKRAMKTYAFLKAKSSKKDIDRSKLTTKLVQKIENEELEQFRKFLDRNEKEINEEDDDDDDFFEARRIMQQISLLRSYIDKN